MTKKVLIAVVGLMFGAGVTLALFSWSDAARAKAEQARIDAWNKAGIMPASY